MSNDNNTAIIDTVKSLHKATPIVLANGREVIALPSAGGGIDIHSTKKYNDEYLTAPERRKGTAATYDIESFVNHVNRFKDDDSVLFADNDPQTPGLLAILDYHKQTAKGEPRFGEHRTQYNFPISKEWKLWNAKEMNQFTQGEFAAFIEDNILDCMAVDESADNEANDVLLALRKLLGGNFASPEKLVTLSRGLAINEDSRVIGKANIATGETTITYETEHKDELGAPIKVPNLFLICIPVFEGGERYRIAVRLRYRVRSGSIQWHYELYKSENTFIDAFKGACMQAEKETGLPLFIGKPE